MTDRNNIFDLTSESRKSANGPYQQGLLAFVV
jgi:hypothetical protein